MLQTILIIADGEFSLLDLSESLNRLQPDLCILHATRDSKALYVMESQSVDLLIVDVEIATAKNFNLLKTMEGLQPRVPLMLIAEPEEMRSIDTERFQIIQILDRPLQADQLHKTLQESFQEAAEGVIQGFSLSGLLQIMEMEQKSCLLDLQGQKAGQLYLLKGKLCHACCGDLKGEEAAKLLLSQENLKIEIKPVKYLTPERQSINIPLQYLLMEAMRLKDEAQYEAQHEPELKKDSSKERGIPGNKQKEIGARSTDLPPRTPKNPTSVFSQNVPNLRQKSTVFPYGISEEKHSGTTDEKSPVPRERSTRNKQNTGIPPHQLLRGEPKHRIERFRSASPPQPLREEAQSREEQALDSEKLPLKLRRASSVKSPPVPRDRIPTAPLNSESSPKLSREAQKIKDLLSLSSLFESIGVEMWSLFNEEGTLIQSNSNLNIDLLKFFEVINRFSLLLAKDYSWSVPLTSRFNLADHRILFLVSIKRLYVFYVVKKNKNLIDYYQEVLLELERIDHGL